MDDFFKIESDHFTIGMVSPIIEKFLGVAMEDMTWEAVDLTLIDVMNSYENMFLFETNRAELKNIHIQTALVVAYLESNLAGLIKSLESTRTHLKPSKMEPNPLGSNFLKFYLGEGPPPPSGSSIASMNGLVIEVDDSSTTSSMHINSILAVIRSLVTPYPLKLFDKISIVPFADFSRSDLVINSILIKEAAGIRNTREKYLYLCLAMVTFVDRVYGLN